MDTTELMRAQQKAVVAAERGDDLAFAALVERIGSLEEAQTIVRNRACLRMAGRAIAAPRLALVLEERDENDPGTPDSPTLHGHFSVFDEWTEIDSMFEGHFLERIAPGAFTKTFREQTPKVTFQHGMDPFLGDKILGKTTRLAEDDVGAAYEVSLFRGLPDLLMEGLRAGEYGSSFRFRVMREEFNNEPDTSDHNPQGLPERTIKEAQVPEYGPVAYPAYPSATAGVRASAERDESGAAPSTADAVDEEPVDTSDTERRDDVTRTWPKVTDEEWFGWNPEI